MTCLIPRSYLVTLWAVLFVSCGATVAQSVAVFDFELIDTSLEGAIRGTRLDEQERLARLSDQLRQLLRASGRFSLVDITPIASEALASNLQACGGCDIQFGIPRANLSADLKSRLAPSLSLSFLPPSFEPPARARPLTPLCPCLFQFDGFDERGQRRASRAHRGGGAAGCNLVFRPIGIAARLQSTTSGSRASLELSQTTNAPARFRRCPI